MVLQALMALQPNHEYREGIVQWLQSQRGTYGWGSTNETAYTILALTDYLLVQQSEAQNTQVTIYLNDTLLLSETLAADNLTIETSIPVDQLADGENQIRIEADAEIPLYYALNQESFIGQAQVEAEGISLTRVYLDAETKEPVTEIQAGDLVLVRLIIVNPEDAFYVILEDHLPGGLEALNEGLNTTSHDVSAAERADYGYYDWNPFHYDDLGYNNKEIRGDRVSFFITELSQGRYVFEYYARATVPGTFTALSAEIAGMYDTTVWGRSASSQFAVNEQPR
jgi:uncharacterized protein YfaS (alpha-2-macroglobulin family)